MNILTRIKNVFEANLEELVNKAEDPELMIKHYLEEAKTQLEEMLKAAAESVASEKMLEKQKAGLLKEATHWEENAKNAVNAKRDDLALIAIEKKEKIDNQLSALETPLQAAKKQSELMKSKVAELKEKIADTENHAAVLIARAKSAKAMEKSAEAVSRISGKSPLDQMKSMEEKINASESRAAALDDISVDPSKKLDDEFTALRAGGSAQDKLAALKAKMNVQ